MGVMNVHEAIRVIQKRVDHLTKRIDNSKIDLSYDKQERSALRFALKALEQEEIKVLREKAKRNEED